MQIDQLLAVGVGENPRRSLSELGGEPTETGWLGTMVNGSSRPTSRSVRGFLGQPMEEIC
jgi:hypothetical protein